MTLLHLATRVEALDGPDHNADIDIAVTLGYLAHEVAGYGPYLRRVYARDCAPLTASIDAVVALITEKLPGGTWDVSHIPRVHPEYSAFVDGSNQEVAAATPALALLAATLRALASQENRK